MQTIASNQSSAEVPINENFENVKWAEGFGRDPTTCTGLTWGFLAGYYLLNGVPTLVAAGTLTLTASVTNYVGLTQAGVVANAATTANPLHIPLFTVVTGTSTVSSYVDTRHAKNFARMNHGIGTQAMADANQTITQALALCDTIVTTGALTGTRNLVVPLVKRRWAIRNTCTGGSIQVIGATGTGVTIATVKTAIVECDGTNVNRITADA